MFVHIIRNGNQLNTNLHSAGTLGLSFLPTALSVHSYLLVPAHDCIDSYHNSPHFNESRRKSDRGLHSMCGRGGRG